MKVVLLLAAGAVWETPALGILNGRRDLVVLKRCVDIADLLAAAASGQADAAVIAIDAPGFDPAAVDQLRAHGVRVVAIVDDDAGATHAGRIGARLRVDVAEIATLPAIITAADEPDPSESPEPAEVGGAGRVVAVWGPLGAPGRTTVAISLAAALGRTARTTLLDVDPNGGTVAQTLGVLDEVSGLLAAARLAGSGLLEEQFASVQRALNEHLTVVTGLPRPDRWPEVRPGTVELLAHTAARHGHVVIDAGSGLEIDEAGGRPGRERVTAAALEVADEIVVVGAADPVGIARLARSMVDLREAHPAGAVRVVVNRMRGSIGWSERDVIQIIEDIADPVEVHFAPDDRLAVDRALVAGRTLFETSPQSQLALALVGVAEALVPGSAPQSGRSPWVRRRRAGKALRR